MPTQIAIGSDLARKLYSVATFATMQRRSVFRGRYTGPAPNQSGARRKIKGQTSPDFPIVRITDLASTAGDQVTVDLYNITTGKPVIGDRKLAGRMMSLSFNTMTARIDQYRAGIEPGGRMSQKRTVHDLRELAKANLSGWAGRLEDQLCQVHLAGARGYDAGADWCVPLESDEDFSDIVVNPILPPTRNRRFFCGDATGAADIATADKLALAEVDKLRVWQAELVHPMQPIKLVDSKGNMDPAAEDTPLYILIVTERVWHYLQAGTTASEWRTFVQNAHARSQGFNHPLFTGETGMWNGILFKRMARPIRFGAGDNVAQYDGSDVVQQVAANAAFDRCLFLGAQALADVFGAHAKSGFHYSWHEEEADHGNQIEVSVAAIGGKAKMRFTVDGALTDHGVATVDCAAEAVAGVPT